MPADRTYCSPVALVTDMVLSLALADMVVDLHCLVIIINIIIILIIIIISIIVLPRSEINFLHTNRSHVHPSTDTTYTMRH